MRTFSDTKSLHIFYAPTQIPVSRQTIRYKLLALNIYMCFIHIKRTLTFDIFSCIEKRKGTYVLSFGSLCELENRNHGKSTRIFSICYRMRRNVLRGVTTSIRSMDVFACEGKSNDCKAFRVSGEVNVFAVRNVCSVLCESNFRINESSRA